MTTDCVIQVVSIFLALLTFVIAHLISRSKDRRVANRETYMQLELAANELFRFEADHVEVIRPMCENLFLYPQQILPSMLQRWITCVRF